MSFDTDRLYQLLPALHRMRDVEQGGPLRALFAVLAEQLMVMEENIEQLYDDQFIETCADWAVPYLGDLIGYQPLHGEALGVGSARAEVAHTIALRRRKGTASVLEQLARDVTGWDARAVEFFQILATTQAMNHPRPANYYAPDLRRWEPLERIGSPFDTVAHTLDVRRITSGRGRYQIPNIGIFLWPVQAHAVTRAPAVQVDARRWRMSPLNHDLPLYNEPLPEDDITHLAEPVNVPMPLSRAVLDQDMRQLGAASVYYGEGRSLALYLNGQTAAVPAADVQICNLADDAGSWAHLPDSGISIDPVLGRIALPAAPNPPVTRIEVSFHYGFSANLGGGEYARATSFAAAPAQQVVRVPDDFSTLQDALDALNGDGVVEITDNGRYAETLAIAVSAGSRIELRCAEGQCATLLLTGACTVTGAADSEFALNGLLVTGGMVQVPAVAGNHLARLRITHATLVPGWTLSPTGEAEQPDAASLVVEIADTQTLLTRAIVGSVRAHAGSSVTATDSIIDATGLERVACAAPDGISAGAALTLIGCTTLGKLHAIAMPLVSNSLLLARVVPGDGWPVAVRAEQRQSGCIRFSWLPPDARVPRRYHCQPAASGAPAPRMVSLRYGTPAYCRVATASDDAIRRGAEDEGEMGVFHHLLAPLRETNLRLRLAEYLRAGLEAGIFTEI